MVGIYVISASLANALHKLDSVMPSRTKLSILSQWIAEFDVATPKGVAVVSGGKGLSEGNSGGCRANRSTTEENNVQRNIEL